MGRPVRAIVQLGRDEHRRNPHVLSSPTAASQASEIDQYAGEDQSGAEAKDPGGADLSQSRELLTVDPSASGRDSRGLGGSDSVSQYEVLKEQLKQQRRDMASAA